MASVADEFVYDVFLSFRGEDTRYGFTGYLKKALDDKGVKTFMDDEQLIKGDVITPALLKAIDESMMAIVVLSKNYANSSFCLKELSKIVDSIKDKGRFIFPVFYMVDPSDVRKLEKTYGEAMDKHKDNSDLIKWKLCLQQVADLNGFHYIKGDGYEHEFIGKIVDQVLRNIKPVPIGNYLVGLEHQKQQVTSLLNVGSDDTIHMVGIYGIGGIGKTTLALEVYNSIVCHFQGSCFLDQVRENSYKHGLTYLQKIFLSQMIGENEMAYLTSVEEGISILRRRLQRKKVILLLDDVDRLEQLEAIVGRYDNWLCPGSRVIITTRDKSLLRMHQVERTYEVKGLNDEDAFDLVGWEALKNKYSTSYKDILSLKHGKELMDVNEKVFLGYALVLKRAVAYASGLPLALKVIGSNFFNNTIEECNDLLTRYERIPHKIIQETLQLSFDSLMVDEQCVFLDIACCFKGWKLTRVEEILHGHRGYFMKIVINVLVDKSLIKINESGYVTLHNLVEAMGKEIVRQESPNSPRKRSRLWSSEEIIQVLEENMGTRYTEIIHLDCWTKIRCHGEAFQKMKNLKTLIISHADFSQSPKHLPNSLRVLQCSNHKYPSSNPFEWEGFFTKKLQKMRILNLDNSERLSRIPDISGLQNLEEFSIQNCDELITIDKSVGFLDKLKILRFKSCAEIRSVPPLSLVSLEELEFSCCCNLESFPLMVNGVFGELKILRVISCNKIRIIPSLMLPSLEELDFSDCIRLESFSHVVDGFGDKLKTMSVRGCHSLSSIPPLKLDLLEKLDLSNCRRLESFPYVVNGLLDNLKFLNIEYCIMLRSIPPLRLTSLEVFNLSYCPNLESFPEMLGEMRNIPWLLLDETPIKELPFYQKSLCKRV